MSEANYHDAKNALWYAHPSGVTTFGVCSVHGCTKGARVGALCGEHAEAKLAAVVGAEMAGQYHSAIDLLRGIEAEMQSKVQEALK